MAATLPQGVIATNPLVQRESAKIFVIVKDENGVEQEFEVLRGNRNFCADGQVTKVVGFRAESEKIANVEGDNAKFFAAELTDDGYLRVAFESDGILGFGKNPPDDEMVLLACADGIEIPPSD